MAKKGRKSQSLSINTIIVAALALIVLVVLAAIFTGRLKIFSQDLQSCAAKQGRCEKSSNDKFPACPNNMAYVSNTDCEKNNPKGEYNSICCVQVISQ